MVTEDGEGWSKILGTVCKVRDNAKITVSKVGGNAECKGLMAVVISAGVMRLDVEK